MVFTYHNLKTMLELPTYVICSMHGSQKFLDINSEAVVVVVVEIYDAL